MLTYLEIIHLSDAVEPINMRIKKCKKRCRLREIGEENAESKVHGD